MTTIQPWTPQKQITKEIVSKHKVIDYVVLSEFDIDIGSTVRHQYPSDIPSVTPDWLAEHCIPEGIHAREEDDLTYLFLNRTAPVLQKILVDENNEGYSLKEGGELFLFGVNICRTKKDDSVKRGAVVKSIAIFSRWSFVESF